MKRVIYILLVAAMLATLLPSRVQAISQVRLIIDNHELSGLDTPPVILNSRVMVPARAVFERVGGTVDWNAASREITVRYSGDILVMTVGQTQAILNGRIIHMEVPPVILADRTLIPLRFPAEAFGFDVAWDHVGRAAILHSPFDYPEEETTHVTDIPTPPPPPQNDPSLARDISSAPIYSVPHAGTNIIDLVNLFDTGADGYAIIASSPITDVNHFLLPDNRLVVDIYNAVSSITGPFAAIGPVSDVRSSQFSRTPNITRVVFDIVGPVEFSLALSYDRQTLTVAFSVNTISSIISTSNEHTDTLRIEGDFQPSIRLSSAGYPNYVIVYIDNARVTAPGGDMPGGNFGSRFTTGQGSNGAAYVRVDIRNTWPSISLTHGSNFVSLSLHDGINGVRYDFATRELRISRDVVTLNVNQVQYVEEYLLNRYTFTLPMGASGLGLGTLYVGDGFINSVNLRQSAAGNTQIVFETARVMAFTIHETATEYIIRGNLPREVYDFIVVIDPGHGGRDPGAGHFGIAEKDVVLAISHMIMELLNQNPNIRAYMTRHTDVTVANSWRVAFANQMADLYVSVHANAVNNRPTVTGIETWYLPNARETAFTSNQLARLIQYRMITATGAVDRGIKNNRNFMVLRDTNMPAALVEVGFLTNQEEAMRLANPQHQRLLAQAIYEGIVAAYEAYGPRR